MERHDRGRQGPVTFLRANLKIRVPQVRCIDADGTMVGVISTKDARALAERRGLDLVEVAANSDPPVCRVMDFGKYRYEESRKQREARKHHHGHDLKEVKFHVNVADHDYQTKLGHMRDFLGRGNKVKVTLTFRGRENAHKDLGFALMTRLLKDCEDLSGVDMTPRLMGRSIVSMLSGRSGKHAGSAPAARPPSPAAPRPAAPAAPRPAPAPAAVVAPVVPAPAPVTAPVAAPVASPVPAETAPAPVPAAAPAPVPAAAV
jgi:translation initiation factor IF-3